MNVERYFRTTDLARAVGISVQLVRNYEADGYLPAVMRSPSGYRRYTQQHLDALLTARQMINGYGKYWTQQIMQAVHAGERARALEIIDRRHAEMAATRTQLDQTLAALRVLARPQVPAATQKASGVAAAGAPAHTHATSAGTPGTPVHTPAAHTSATSAGTPASPITNHEPSSAQQSAPLKRARLVAHAALFGRAKPIRISGAAKLVGVRVSTVRFWEQEGLLTPSRERGSNYRVFDANQVQRLQVIALLRQANYDVSDIRPILDELDAGDPQRAVLAVEQRRSELADASWRCLGALARLYAYVEQTS